VSCGVTDGLDRETVATVQRVLSVVGMLCELWSYGWLGQGDSGKSAEGTECSGYGV
jgi:hypothetical protein